MCFIVVGEEGICLLLMLRGKRCFLLNERLFTLIFLEPMKWRKLFVWNSCNWGINGWVILSKRWPDQSGEQQGFFLDQDVWCQTCWSFKMSALSRFFTRKSIPTRRSWSSQKLELPKLSSCAGFSLFGKKIKERLPFTCFNPVDGIGKNGLIRGREFFGPQRFSGMVELSNPWMGLFIKVSSLVSKDSRRYSYSHQKQGESQKPSFSSIVPHVNYIYIPFFSCERFSQSQNGGEETSIAMLEVFWDSWASAVWIWNWLCGKIVSLLKIWTYKIGPPDPVINRILTIHICGLMGFTGGQITPQWGGWGHPGNPGCLGYPWEDSMLTYMKTIKANQM